MTQPFYDEDMARRQEKLSATSDMVAQRQMMLSALNLKQGEHVLDIGSGNGIFAREMGQVVSRSGCVCGVDSAEPMIKMATVLCPEGQFLLGDAADLPVEDNSFDAVTAVQLLCFIADVNKALSEMFRVLRPGGRLVILDSDWGSLVWNCRDKGLMDRVITMYTAPYADAHIPRTLSRRLVETGFRLTDRRAFCVLNWQRNSDSYSQQTVGFIKSMMEASDEFTEEDWLAWQADQEATAAAGDYMFSLNRYIFSAARP